MLDESVEVLRAERGVLITRTRHGLVCANAGVDQSNVPGDDIVCLLPLDPDALCRGPCGAQLGNGAAVVIADSFGRAWRLGQADVAIGCAGLAPLDDRRGTKDAEGRELIGDDRRDRGPGRVGGRARARQGGPRGGRGRARASSAT